jgi:geranylgeranyl reductase family protein
MTIDHSFDVVVAGAGPAGAVAARMLAQAGARVALVDKAMFPRDKTCGDGLIPDSIAALRACGSWDAVAVAARGSSLLEVLAPNGTAVPIHGEYRVVKRRVFDHLLFEQAVSAGATFIQAKVVRPVEDDGAVTGVVIDTGGGESQLRAPLTLLATGAEAAILKKFDATARTTASGYAIRTYAKRRGPGAELDRLYISLERDLLPGYAWAFPGPDDVINVGVGVFYSSNLREKQLNLRTRLDRLMAGGGNLGRILGPLEPLEKYAGAPLRTGLTGSSLGRRGLCIIGDAAGTTYGLTGEGIGKSMESGLLAAELATQAADVPAVGEAYRTAMTSRYTKRFATYQTAERWMRVPAFANFVAWRANRSPWVLKHLTAVLSEDALPDRVFSARAIWALLTR